MVCIELRVGADHKHFYHFACFLIGHANGGALGYIRMGGQGLLQFVGVHIKARDNNHIF